MTKMRFFRDALMIGFARNASAEDRKTYQIHSSGAFGENTLKMNFICLL